MATRKAATVPPADEIADEVVACVFTSCTARVKIRDLPEHLTSAKKKHISSYKGSEVRDLIVKLSEYVLQLESERKQQKERATTSDSELEWQDKTPNDVTSKDIILMMFEHKKDVERKIAEEHAAIQEELQCIEMAIDDSRNSSLFQKWGITSSEYIKNFRAEIKSEKRACQCLQQEKEGLEQQLRTQQQNIIALEETKKELAKEKQALQALLQEQAKIQQENVHIVKRVPEKSEKRAFQRLQQEKEGLEQQLRTQQQNNIALEETKKEIAKEKQALQALLHVQAKAKTQQESVHKHVPEKSEKRAFQRLQQEKEGLEQQLRTQQQNNIALEETKEKLAREKQALQALLQEKAQQESVHKHVPEDAEKEITRLKESLNEVQRRRCGHQVVDGVEHAHLSASYSDLFSKDWQKAYDFLTTTQHMGKMQARWLIGAMFEKSYIAYKEHIFSTLFDDVFTPNTSGYKGLKAVKAKADAYGDFIHQYSETEDLYNPSKVQEKVIQKYLPNLGALLMSGGGTTPVMAFLQKAIELSRQMLTIHPPMIVSTPMEFNEDVHERHPSHWDDDVEEVGKFTLVYFRPVLYSSYEEVTPEKKGQVGTHPVQST